MPLRRAKRVAKQIVRVGRRRQSATERINGGQFHVAVELFAKCDARSPTAGGAAVISETGGKIVLKIVGGGQVAAPAENGHVTVVVVEACDLKLPASTNFSFRRNFFVQPVLQNGTAPPPEQRGKCIQFIECRRERTTRLCVVRFEWTGPAGQGDENESGAPIIGEAHIQFRAWPERRGCGPESHQYIFAAIPQNRAIPKRQRAPLIKTDTPEDWPNGSQLGFAKDQRRVRTGAESSRWQPHRGDAAGRGISVVAHLAGQDQSAGAA